MCWPNLRTCLNFYSRGRWPSPGQTAWWTRTYREYIYWQISWVKQRGGPTNHSKNTELQGKGRSPIIDSAQSIQALVGNMNCKLFTTTSNKADRRMTKSREEEYRTRIHQVTVLDPESWHEQTKNPWFGEGETSAICERLLVDHLYAQLGFVEFKSCAGRNVPEKLKKTPCSGHTFCKQCRLWAWVQYNEHYCHWPTKPTDHPTRLWPSVYLNRWYSLPKMEPITPR